MVLSQVLGNVLTSCVLMLCRSEEHSLCSFSLLVPYSINLSCLSLSRLPDPSVQLRETMDLCLSPILLFLLPYPMTITCSLGTALTKNRIISFVDHFSVIIDVLHYESHCLLSIFPFFVFCR